MHQIPDDIVRKAAAGDIAAFESIYRQTSGFVYNVAFRITGSPEDAAEVTQDVFVKAYRYLGSFEARSSVTTWLYRIAVNTSFNYAKKTGRRQARTVSFDDVPESAIVSDVTKNDLADHQARESISALLDVLNADQRACIVLREIEGLTYQEISRTLRVTINTVRTRLKRARERMLLYGKRGGR